jgi:hypothetical protein
VTSVLLFAAIVGSQEIATARREVEQTFRRWERVVARQDVAGMARMMHPSGVTVGLDGSRWKFSRAKQDLPGMFAGRRHFKLRINIDRFIYEGGEAVAWVTMRTDYEMKTRDKWVQKTATSRHADTLRKFADGWKFVYSQDLP